MHPANYYPMSIFPSLKHLNDQPIPPFKSYDDE